MLEILQASSPSKGNLPGIEALVARAMEIDPFVVEARAKLEKARAEVEAAQANLERTRIRVTREIIESRARWEVAKRVVEHLDGEVKKNPKDEGMIRRYIDARAQLAQIEADMPLLSAPGATPMAAPTSPSDTFGKPTPGEPKRPFVWADTEAQSKRPWWAAEEPVPPPRTSATSVAPQSSLTYQAFGQKAASEAIAKALNTPVEADFNEQPLRDVLAWFSDGCKVQFILASENVPSGLGMGAGAGGPGGLGEGKSKALADMPVTLHLKGVPLSAILQAIEDTCEPVRFVVRPYGILVTTSWRTDGR